MQNKILQTEPKKLRELILKLKNTEGFNILLDITANDYLNYSLNGKENSTSTEKKLSRFELIYILRNENKKDEILVKCFAEDIALEVPSISDIFYSANWAERETFDQYGINFTNHPNLKRLLNHHQFIGHPLRKDYEITKGQICTTTDDLMDEMTPFLKEQNLGEEDVMLLNVGPSHPATHGTIRNFMALEGESILKAVTEIGYLHRGFEKSCENHTYSQIIPYTDRLNYCSSILNNIAYTKTIEDMLELKIPNRAKYIRVIVGELSRIIDHLVCNAANCVDLGGLTNFWYLYNPRDEAYDILSKLTGARLTNSYTRIGGLAHDLYKGFEEDLETVLKSIEKAVDDGLSLIAHNKIFIDRTQDVGVIKQDFALSAGITGPNLRATGLAQDLRKDKPCYFYDNFDFDVVVGSHGDVYDRMMVRFEEIAQSTKIIRQAIKMMPKGSIIVDNKAVVLPKKKDVHKNIESLMNQFKLTFEGVKVPEGEFYGSYEGANGELGFYVRSDGSGTPYKVKCRPPCFYALGAYAKIIENTMLADAVVTMASMNFIAGEFDR